MLEHSHVYLYKCIKCYLDELHGDKLEPFLLKSGDNFTDKTSTDSIGFEHKEGSFFSVSTHFETIL